MNDRYLFRAKRIDTGEWYIGNLVDCPDGRNVIAEVGGNWALHEVDPSTICQCTGLKDKNGNMVFENDIMVGYLDDIFQDNATYAMVIWHNNGFCTHQIHCDDYELIDEFDQNHFTVCGNIFDNPYLFGRNDRRYGRLLERSDRTLQ